MRWIVHVFGKTVSIVATVLCAGIFLALTNSDVVRIHEDNPIMLLFEIVLFIFGSLYACYSLVSYARSGSLE